MPDKVKTTIVIDRELWYKFKLRLLESGIEEVSNALERLVREELLEDYVVEELTRLVGGEVVSEVKPVKPLAETNAGRAVREMRESRL
uniref:CopG family transcriptional regulator n=1 Tax=Thermogladius calderae TaxID=1200300 RepID=A0A7J3XZ57_9CREN